MPIHQLVVLSFESVLFMEHDISVYFVIDVLDEETIRPID